MRARSIAATVGFLVFAFFSFSLKREMRGNDLQEVMLQRGMAAPNFQAADMNGNRVDLYEIAKTNKSVLVTFWATWCDPCRVELTNFAKMYAGKKKAGMEFLAVNLDPQEIQNAPFVKELPFPVLLDQGQSIAKLFGVRSLPSSVILGSGAAPRVEASMEGSFGAAYVARMYLRP